jgi:AraC family transcriptional regulator
MRRVALAPVAADAVRRWPGMRSEYAWVPPHPEVAEAATVTHPHQVGVAFSGHRRLVYESRHRTATADVAPGSTVVSAGSAITWLRVHEVTEALEIYPDAELVRAVAAVWASRPVDVDQVVGRPDGTVLGIGSVLRQAHVSGAALDDVAAGALAHRLVVHLLTRYGGVRLPARAAPGLLDARTVDDVAGLVEARLGGPLALDDLAAVAHLSPFHFARAFARTTGLPPHAFVVARRMDRAGRLLWTTDLPVEDVARAVGYENLSHFRRLFRRHHGVPPSALRGR